MGTVCLEPWGGVGGAEWQCVVHCAAEKKILNAQLSIQLSNLIISCTMQCHSLDTQSSELAQQHRVLLSACNPVPLAALSPPPSPPQPLVHSTLLPSSGKSAFVGSASVLPCHGTEVTAFAAVWLRMSGFRPLWGCVFSPGVSGPCLFHPFISWRTFWSDSHYQKVTK